MNVTSESVAVRLINLSKTYPVPLYRLRKFLRHKIKEPVEALRGVSLEIKRGEIFGIIGRNGAGKTTLAKVIATLVQPTAGTAQVFGHDSVRDGQAVRALVGLATAEERSFYWRLTVTQNLMFFARLYGLSDAEAMRRITELLTDFELEANRYARFGELSTGNKQRVAFARAMLMRPPLLLLDEPTRSLDPLAAARMRALITRTAQAETTILLTSHNLAEIEELCGRVAVISRGEIKETDTPHALRQLHQTDERVELSVTLEAAQGALETLQATYANVILTAPGPHATLSFTRRPDDESLDDAIRLLHQHGARIYNITTERTTLLNVIEKYE